MPIDITNISYFSFRMAPLIIVSYFVLQSLLNWDVKGIIYLAGLLFSSVAIVMLNGPMKHIFRRELTSRAVPHPKCTMISLGENGNLSAIPLSIGVYSYTFFYLLIFILNQGNKNDDKGILGEKLSTEDLNTAFRQNIPVMIIFPLLIIFESIWIVKHNCVWKPTFYILAAFMVGSIGGVLWGIMITSLKNNSIMYVGNSGAQVCSRPSQTYFSCKVVPKSVATV